MAFDGVRGDAGDVHGRRARTLASTRLCLAAQAAASSASRSKFAWAVPFLWPFAGLGRRGARGDAHDVPGRRARTLARAGTRRSSLLSPSHGSSHPPADARFDASFSTAFWHLAMLVCFPCRFKLLRQQRSVPPKAESVDGKHASQPSRIKLPLRRLRPIRRCTAVIPPSLQFAMQRFIRIGEARAKNKMSIVDAIVTASTDRFRRVGPHVKCCKVHTRPWNVSWLGLRGA